VLLADGQGDLREQALYLMAVTRPMSWLRPLILRKNCRGGRGFATV